MYINRIPLTRYCYFCFFFFCKLKVCVTLINKTNVHFYPKFAYINCNTAELFNFNGQIFQEFCIFACFKDMQFYEYSTFAIQLI